MLYTHDAPNSTNSQKSMSGVWLDGSKLSFRNNLCTPELQQREALIRTRLAGICGTDIQLLKGYYGFSGIPGHEFVGEVIEASDNPELVGKRVVGEINITCGACGPCKTNQSHHCEHRDVLGIRNHNGVFAEFFTLPVQNLHMLPDDVSDEDAVFVEPLAAALRITQQVVISRHSRVLLIGAGKLGQLIALLMQTLTDQLTVVTRHENQNNLLNTEDIKTINEKNLGSQQWDMIIEATGSPSGIQTALKHVSPRGTVVLKSTYSKTPSVDLSRAVVNEINIIGSRCGPFQPAIDLLQSRKIKPSKLIDRQFPLSEALLAFDYAQRPAVGKVILSFL